MNNTALVSAYALLDKTAGFFRNGTRELLSDHDKQTIESYLTRVYTFMKDIPELSSGVITLATFVGDLVNNTSNSDLFNRKEDLSSTFFTLSVDLKMDIVIYLADHEFDMMTGMEPTLMEMVDFAINNGYYFDL